MPDKWFSNRGQIIQTCLTGLACAFSGVKAWPDISKNDMLTLGALLFYCLVAVVLISFARLVHAYRQAHSANLRGVIALNIPSAPVMPQSPPILPRDPVQTKAPAEPKKQGSPFSCSSVVVEVGRYAELPISGGGVGPVRLHLLDIRKHESEVEVRIRIEAGFLDLDVGRDVRVIAPNAFGMRVRPTQSYDAVVYYFRLNRSMTEISFTSWWIAVDHIAATADDATFSVYSINRIACPNPSLRA
jgi:hypothetical protein